jgi:hypothetical protein
MGLHTPGRGYQLYPGLSPERITCLALHAGSNSLAGIGTLGRHSSENRCGASFNGSVLPVSSHSMCGLYLSLVSLLKESQNGFLVVTLASGIIASLPGIVNSPTSVPTLLAQNLPKSSTFFLT